MKTINVEGLPEPAARALQAAADMLRAEMTRAKPAARRRRKSSSPVGLALSVVGSAERRFTKMSADNAKTTRDRAFINANVMIYTFNTSDFNRLAEIKALTP